MAYYHANMMPALDAAEPVSVDRKAAMAAGALLETPAEAKARFASGGAKPDHYNPTPAVGRNAPTKRAENRYATNYQDVKKP